MILDYWRRIRIVAEQEGGRRNLCRWDGLRPVGTRIRISEPLGERA